jgi:hypothetical protein
MTARFCIGAKLLLSVRTPGPGQALQSLGCVAVKVLAGAADDPSSPDQRCLAKHIHERKAIDLRRGQGQCVRRESAKAMLYAYGRPAGADKPAQQLCRGAPIVKATHGELLQVPLLRSDFFLRRHGTGQAQQQACPRIVSVDTVSCPAGGRHDAIAAGL